MIGWPQILTAAVVTALGVEITAMAVRWPVSTTLSASLAAILVIVAWRGRTSSASTAIFSRQPAWATWVHSRQGPSVPP